MHRDFSCPATGDELHTPEGLRFRMTKADAGFTHAHTETCTGREDKDMTSHTDGLRQGAAPSSTHAGGSHETQAQTATSPPPLGLAEAEGHLCSTHPTLSGFTSTHTFVDPLSTGTAPLPTRPPFLDPSPPYSPHGP